jgi:homoserine O-succinyltransferase
MFGVFKHRIVENDKLLQGLDDIVYVPHSRHTKVEEEDILESKELDILLSSKDAGVALVISKDKRHIFMTGHAEYDPDTLDNEYKRDLEKELEIQMPKYYYEEDDIKKGPLVRWRSHAYILFFNWLNYYVYQVTPFDLDGAVMDYQI